MSGPSLTLARIVTSISPVDQPHQSDIPTEPSRSRKRPSSPSLLSDSVPPKRLKVVHMNSDSSDAPDFRSLVDNNDPSCGSGDSPTVSSKGKARDDSATVDQMALSDSLALELQCGCCAELLYNPVMVLPCQHFFCGSCCTLWFRNGGASCPHCRAASISVVPARVIQAIIDTLLKADPTKERLIGERRQADEVYVPGMPIRIPTPRQASPEPNVSNSSSSFARPCTHCRPNNEFDWTCPIPVVNPLTDPEHAWRVENGSPPGHAWCGNCDSLHASQAPTSRRCDLCQVSFCGIGIPGRCCTMPLLLQHPQGLQDLSDILTSGEIYDIFEGNSVEVDILLDYLQVQNLSPRQIYRNIAEHILSLPQGFTPLIESGIFNDLYMYSNSEPQQDPDPSAPRRNICRLCAAEVFFWGLKDWWIRERRKGLLSSDLLNRPNCASYPACSRQSDPAHAKEFNHVIAGTDAPQVAFLPNPPDVAPEIGPEARTPMPVSLRDLLVACAPAVPDAGDESGDSSPGSSHHVVTHPVQVTQDQSLLSGFKPGPSSVEWLLSSNSPVDRSGTLQLAPES
ncbi:hypothetical protein SISNIDRAFT_485680 [Sistotremastrum niveocremeum HHB9708]|uniref:RING-type domain-containing protein n=1 Tax=Sistotremastrum niveocremeum HHB9708 TaxID=1314777 RepID=A0A164UPQ8_9AGAM|nr:hypothetical protein SISNIDRAFT_485680 [Sistotremastrum niveocremeum HHB9708]